MSKFDGGCDLSLLKEMPALDAKQTRFLKECLEEAWRSEYVVGGKGGEATEHLPHTPIKLLRVAQTPGYLSLSRSGLCPDREAAEADAARWQKAFCQDLQRLSSTLLQHRCSESCYKYSDNVCTSWKFCRHGFHHAFFARGLSCSEKLR